jgi:uncharacterized protein
MSTRETEIRRDEILERTEAFIREQLSGDSSGHDWWHIARVRAAAINIGREEHADLYIVELAALLHDVADWKFHGGDEEAGPKAARAWLKSIGADSESIDHVCEIIATISFKGANVATPMRTLEGRVVQDADRLDAIGAVGIARTFAYGGHAGQPMHDPTLPAEAHASFADYKSKRTTTINHFYEKLLLLKERMNTATGRRLAEARHAYMETFLRQFDNEWNGRS